MEGRGSVEGGCTQRGGCERFKGVKSKHSI